jgi:nucleoid DNA-binding protein
LGVYEAVAKTTGLKPKDVQKSVEGFIYVAAAHLKTQGGFSIRGLLSLKLHKAKKKSKKRKLQTPAVSGPPANPKASGSQPVSFSNQQKGSLKTQFQGFYD